MAGKKDKIKDNERFSAVVPRLDRCMLCGSEDRVAIHEIFYGSANRKKSKEDGMCVPLCLMHHNGGSGGVHFNPSLDTYLKKLGQKVWMKEYGQDDPTAEFIKRYGRNYLD